MTERQRANDSFTAVSFVCLHPSELLRRRRRTLNSDVHETQAGSDWLKFSLIPWMKSFEKLPWKKWSVLKRPYTWSKRTRKNRCEQSLIYSNVSSIFIIPCKQNKTKQKKSKLCFLLGRLWSLLSRVWGQDGDASWVTLLSMCSTMTNVNVNLKNCSVFRHLVTLYLYITTHQVSSL